LFRAGLDVFLCEFCGEEGRGGFDNDLGAGIRPLEGGRVAVRGDADSLAVYDKGSFFGLYGSIESTVGRSGCERIWHVLGINNVVDAHDLDVVALDCRPKGQAADAAKTVDTYFSHYEGG